MIVLCVNTGSSSLKFALYEGEERLATGAVENLGAPSARAWIVRGEVKDERAAAGDTPRDALALAFSLLGEDVGRVGAVAHRVVHGGPDHTAPARVTSELLESLRALVPLAPLHMPSAIAGIEAVAERLPRVVQTVSFDTAFHAEMPEVARRLPLPERFDRAHVRRYGFHGLSFEYVMGTLNPAPPRVILAHLGSGASLAAVKDGKSIDTTMGLTPTGGIPMGTRSGDLDPGVLLYLMRQMGLQPQALGEVVEQESGLRGIGGTSDMKRLLERRTIDPKAALAVLVFAYGVKKAIGGFMAAMGGLDLLVFTGGIGEKSPEVRALACEGLGDLGIEIDPTRNAASDAIISARSGKVEVRVVPTDEDLVLSRHARALLETKGATGSA